MSDTNTTKELLNTKEIERNTNAIRELQKALEAYQATLNQTSNSDSSILDNIKKIILAMDTLQAITSKFKNVGRGKMFPLTQC